MGKLGKDAKDLLVGNDGSEKEPKDFKVELQDAIKDGTVKKSDGTLMITARLNVDKFGEKITKQQENGVKKAAKEARETIEEIHAEKKKEERNKEKERKRKEMEIESARKMQEDSVKNDMKNKKDKAKELNEK